MPTPLAVSLLVAAALSSAATAQTPSIDKVARSRAGMVASGSPFATAAGVEILERGGNAADAAAATTFAMMVVDPANTSIAGRVQLLVRRADGVTVPIDGATQVPGRVLGLAAGSKAREGFGTVPAPGGVAALAELVRRHGRLSLGQVLQPAITLAEHGFAVPSRLAESWGRVARQLARDPGAARHFLKPDGSSYREGETFRQPALAAVLRAVADSGAEVFYRGRIADQIARDVASGGGSLRLSDLHHYRVEPGVLVETEYRGRQVFSAGGRAWGNTLGELLNILAHFPVDRPMPEPERVEILARVIAQAMADRPQAIGTLAPKPNAIPLERISSPEFGARRAREIQAAIDAGSLPPDPGAGKVDDHDTTHLSVVDREGNAVALTTSIGPSFGSRVVSPELGFLYAYSYRMRDDSVPGVRDLTEMTPTIVLEGDRPILVLGGAGSERIPTSVLMVLTNVVDRGMDLEASMRAPRVFALGRRVRLHDWTAPQAAERLRARGFEVSLVPLGASPHLGLVHAVAFDRDRGEFVGAADFGDAGAAAGPR
ncbi:MAG: gamma-glutamyltransferase family protein [Gemmatimonadales bacterium]